MTIRTSKAFLLFFFLQIVLFAGVHAAPLSSSSRSYGLPIGELNHILTDWLDRSGVDVTVRESDMGELALQFRRDGRSWEIGLRPESALGTRVTFAGDKKDPQSLKFEEELWAFINAYVGPNHKDIESDAPEPVIPKVVYSRTGIVVCINTQSNGMSSQFSGFVIDDEGGIICTAHDLKKYKTIKITDQDGKAYLGKVVKLDMTRDLALIQSQLKPRVFLSLSQGRKSLRKDETIYAIGCPMNQLGKIIVGRVAEPPVRANQLHYWKVLMETSPGSSGSPVFDDQGVLVGMVKGRYRGTNTIGFLIPIDRIRAFLNEP